MSFITPHDPDDQVATMLLAVIILGLIFAVLGGR